MWIPVELLRGLSRLYGEQCSKETLVKSASSKAFASTTEAGIGERTVELHPDTSLHHLIYRL